MLKMIPKNKPYFNSEEIKALFNFSDDIVEKFEEKFAKIVGSKYALSFPYGRTCLYALLKSNNIKKAEVLIPAYTCIVVPHAIIMSGNIPKFIDINLYDFNMDLNKLDECVSEKTKVIIPTHMYGYPLNVRKIRDILENLNRKDIIIFEDACLAILTKDVGKYSDATFYSFSISKQIVTFDGGMITTNNEELYTKLKDYRSNFFKKSLISKDLKKCVQLFSSYFIFNEKIYSFIFSLWKKNALLRRYTKNWSIQSIKMPNDFHEMYSKVQAKIGIAQLTKIKEIIEKRREIAKIYDKSLKDISWIILPPLIDGATYSHYSIRVNRREKFESMIKGIHVGKTFDYSIPHTSLYSQYVNEKNSFRNSLIASKEVLNLPNFPSLSADQIKYIVEIIHEIDKSFS
jgi:dTDP-4-amino-4,6-dideoxygalactose transaminase